MNEVILLISLSLVVIVSPYIAKILRVPTTPVEIILGSVLGAVGLLYHDIYFELVAEVGFLYLMFIAGTEVNLKDVLKTNPDLMRRIMVYMALLYGFSIGFSLYFDLGKVFMVLLPLLSVGLIATLSKEYGKQDWLTLSMTVGGIGEVVSIAVLTLVRLRMGTHHHHLGADHLHPVDPFPVQSAPAALLVVPRSHYGTHAAQ
jgi:Kef-type K+ transport system membrane component KefB